MLTAVMRFGTLSSLLIACNGKFDTTNTDIRVIHGTAVQHHVTENGIVDQPRDLSTTTVQSYPGPASRTQGVGAPDGSFDVAVEGTPAWVELTLDGERLFLPGNARAPDVGAYTLGRADVQFPAANTSVAFDLSGLGAWQPTDSLQIVSPNVGLTMAGPEGGFTAPPRTGATAIRGQTLDWKANLAPIIDAAKGDTTWVTQMTSTASDARSYYSTLVRAGVARGFTLRDGQPATLSATLAPVALDRTLTLHWKGSEFAALALQAGPGARPGAAPALSIKTLPDALARHNSFFRTSYLGLPSLVDFGPIPGSADHDQAIKYGNPFSSSGAAWTEFVTMTYAAPVRIPTPQGIGMVSAMMVAALPVSSLAATGVIAPSISPVRRAQIEGQALDLPRTAVGTSPTITWEAPVLGTATSYAVVVHGVETSKAGVNVTRLATFHTNATSLQLPEGVLTPGSSYVLTITAISAKGADLTSRPLVGTLPYASADYVTARFTP